MTRGFVRPLLGRSETLRRVDGVPGGRPALEWLLETRDLKGRSSGRMLNRLMPQKPGGPFWQVSSNELEHLVNDGVRSNRRPPAHLGVILCGLGELAARCHADIRTPIARWLSRHRRLINLQDVLHDAATARAPRPLPIRSRDRQRTAHGVGTVAYILSHDSLTPELWATSGQLKEGRIRLLSMRYGLMFVARLALIIKPQTLMRWTRTTADQFGRWAVIEMLEDVVLWSGNDAERIAGALLDARDPLCTALAAHLLVDPPFRGPVPPLAASWDRLVAAGVSEEDACWLCSPALTAIDQRAREGAAHVDHLQKSRAALGEDQPDRVALNAEIARIEGQLVVARAQQAENEAARTGSRPAVADLLRRSVISLDTWQLILKELPHAPAERHALADAVGRGEARRQLLTRNVSDLSAAIGTETDQAFADHFLLEQGKFQTVSAGAALATIALAIDAKKNIGKATSHEIFKLVGAAQKALAEPYLRTRRYTRWRSALSRYACAVAFAFAVAEAVPQERRAEISRLVADALDHAREVFKQTPEPFAADEWWFQHLCTCTVRWLQIEGRHDEIETMAEDTGFPTFARSLAIWSDPALASRHTPLALTLFGKANARWPGEAATLAQAARAVASLDLAVGCCGAEGVIDVLRPIWREISASWGTAIDTEWSPMADRLIGAVRGDEPARSQVLADGRFDRSCCRWTIGRSSGPATV